MANSSGYFLSWNSKFRLLIYAGWFLGWNLYANWLRLFFVLTYSRRFAKAAMLSRTDSPLPTTTFKIYPHVFVYTHIIIMEQFLIRKLYPMMTLSSQIFQWTNSFVCFFFSKLLKGVFFFFVSGQPRKRSNLFSDFQRPYTLLINVYC